MQVFRLHPSSNTYSKSLCYIVMTPVSAQPGPLSVSQLSICSNHPHQYCQQHPQTRGSLLFDAAETLARRFQLGRWALPLSLPSSTQAAPPPSTLFRTPRRPSRSSTLPCALCLIRSSLCYISPQVSSQASSTLNDVSQTTVPPVYALHSLRVSRYRKGVTAEHSQRIQWSSLLCVPLQH